MNVGSWCLSAMVSTVCLTMFMVASQELRFTRVNLPYLLGTMFTADRSRAKLWGTLAHLVNGLIFSLGYVALFESWNQASWWRGAGIGLFHGVAVLLLGLPVLPGFHPRMASETMGPTAKRLLEPPGAFALHYGRATPLFLLLAHLLFGALLGAMYRVA